MPANWISIGDAAMSVLSKIPTPMSLAGADHCRDCGSASVHLKCVWHPHRANTATIVQVCTKCGAETEPEKQGKGMTEEEIEAGKSPAGGFTRKQLEAWGVPWPPRKGWKEDLLNGRPVRR